MRDIFRNDEDHAALAAWFDAWGDHVAAVDFTGARALFEDDVIGFGTWMDVVDGLTNLEATQWPRDLLGPKERFLTRQKDAGFEMTEKTTFVNMTDHNLF